MLRQLTHTLRRWSERGANKPFASVETWAKGSGFRFRRAKDDLRFVIDAAPDAPPLRLEWGPSQRSYIAPNEMRIRMDLGLPNSLQMLVLSRPLMEQLEKETFERYTQEAQTMIDMSTPEEMRWLAMFPQADLSFDKPLRARFCAFGADPLAALAWIKGPLGARLGCATQDLLAAEPPFALMTMRGKVYLRMQLADPNAANVVRCLEVFDAATQSVLQLADRMPVGDGEWPATASTAWQTQTQIDDEPPIQL
jgi:hypothetical protein